MNGGWTNEGRGERGEGEGDSGQKSITKLIAVFAVNGNGDHLLAVKPRSRFFLSLSLSLSLYRLRSPARRAWFSAAQRRR